MPSNMIQFRVSAEVYELLGGKERANAKAREIVMVAVGVAQAADVEDQGPVLKTRTGRKLAAKNWADADGVTGLGAQERAIAEWEKQWEGIPAFGEDPEGKGKPC